MLNRTKWYCLVSCTRTCHHRFVIRDAILKTKVPEGLEPVCMMVCLPPVWGCVWNDTPLVAVSEVYNRYVTELWGDKLRFCEDAGLLWAL